jgi:lysophospholipase L1-like esterase
MGTRDRPVLSWRRKLVYGLVATVLVFAGIEAALALAARLYFRPSPAAGRADGSFRVVALGDSFTYGVHVPPGTSYPAQLDRLLRERCGVSWDVVNRGSPGVSPLMFYQDIDSIIEQTRPDLMLVWAGFNVNDGDILRYRSALGDDPSPPRGRLVRQLEYWLSRLRTYRVYRYLVIRYVERPMSFEERIGPWWDMELFGFEDYQRVNHFALDLLIRAIVRRGVPLVLLNYPQAPVPAGMASDYEYYYAIQMQHLTDAPLTPDDYLYPRAHDRETAINGIVRHLGRLHGVPVADVSARFHALEQDDDYAAYFLANDEHANARGYAVVAETVLETLVEAGFVDCGPTDG